MHNDGNREIDSEAGYTLDADSKTENNVLRKPESEEERDEESGCEEDG